MRSGVDGSGVDASGSADGRTRMDAEFAGGSWGVDASIGGGERSVLRPKARLAFIFIFSSEF